MNILIIGATRGIGRQLLEQALEQGHSVTVIARHPQKINLPHRNLTVIEGDILDPEAVNRAVAGQEAVFCTIGMKPTRKPVTVFSEGIKNVLQAMQTAGVRRLICVTGIGAGETRGHGGFLYDKIVNPLLLKTIYEDKDRQEALVKASDRDWSIVRPGFLTNGPLTGNYRVITDISGVTAGKISRADVAHFLLRQLKSDAYLKQTPLLMY